MGDEIQEYLVAKLKDAIKEEGQEHGQPPPPKSAPKRLKNLLGENISKLNREQLYAVKNLLTEWQMKHSKEEKTSSNLWKSSIAAVTKIGSIPYDHYELGQHLKKIEEQLKLIPPSQHGVQSSSSNTDTATQQPQPTPPSNSNHTQSSTSSGSSSSSAEEQQPYRWSTRSVDPNKVHGLKDKVMSLQRMLVSGKELNSSVDQFKAIGIVGMGGIGKTTLCQVIFANQEVKSKFLPRIWVCVSKKPGEDEDPKKVIVKRMLECLGVNDDTIKFADTEQQGLKRLLFTLRLELAGKRYLIVLDDVWNTADDYMKFCSDLSKDEKKCCEELAYGLPKEFGGTVIVTSRSEEIAKGMVGEDNLHRLQRLTEGENCWQIFKDSVERDGIELSEALKSLKGKIIDKCDGLPLAAKMMGQIAYEKLKENKLATGAEATS